MGGGPNSPLLHAEHSLVGPIACSNNCFCKYTHRDFHLTPYYLQVYSVNGEIYPKTKERPWPNIPQHSCQCPIWDWLPIPFTHLTVNCYTICLNRYPYNFLLALSWATWSLHTSLIHGFLRFTTEEIIGISEEWNSRQLIPNSDSAIAINYCFYCSPDSHTTFTCDNRSATT